MSDSTWRDNLEEVRPEFGRNVCVWGGGGGGGGESSCAFFFSFWSAQLYKYFHILLHKKFRMDVHSLNVLNNWMEFPASVKYLG